MTEKLKKIDTYEELAQYEIDRFIKNPGLDDLARLFSAHELPKDPNKRLLTLQDIAAEYWDFRKGAERVETSWDSALLDKEGSEQWNIIFEAANKLGLVEDSESVIKKPEFLVILGGANKAPFDRFRYGLEKVKEFGHLVYLGSSRIVSDKERENAREYAPSAKTEAELGYGAFEKLLNARVVHEINERRDGDIWGMRLYEFEYNGVTMQGFALSTPQQIGSRRANTYDNFKFFADRAELGAYPNASVVSVTTGFYTAGQHFPAVQELTLRYGTQVETIGHSAAYSGAKRLPGQLLQETKAGIDAAVRLQTAIDDLRNANHVT